MASEKGHTALVKLLLEHPDINVNLQDASSFIHNKKSLDHEYEDIKINGIGFNQHNINHGHNITREELVNGKNLDFLYNRFRDTHDFKKIFVHQGYVLVRPKI